MLDMNKLDDLLTAYDRAARADEKSPTVNHKHYVREAWVAIVTYVADATRSQRDAPFDEAAARAGKPIEVSPPRWAQTTPQWMSARFVGVTPNGKRVVTERDACNVIESYPFECVRMAAPKMRTLYLNIATHHVGVYRTEADAKKHAASGTTHIAYPVEVPE